MPRAEVGSTKHLNNQMKAKGLQRLRWYCQACSRQMRDENGFKCHVASESHVRNMMVIGEDPRKAINEFSQQFQRDFVQLLRTGHGEKKVNVNHFYQEYIANKEHVHMNATKWASLTEFAKHLGRQGICRVEEDEKNNERGGASGLTVSWIDNSPEALRRQNALKNKEAQDRGDEQREQRLIQEQIRRARREGAGQDEDDGEEDSEMKSEGIKRKDGEKIVLSFGPKKDEKPPTPPVSDNEDLPDKSTSPSGSTTQHQTNEGEIRIAKDSSSSTVEAEVTDAKSPHSAVKPISFGAAKQKNVFASLPKKNALGGAKKPVIAVPQKPLSNAERIMKEELERKRSRETNGSGGFKKQRIS